jgi:hypothetical protein
MIRDRLRLHRDAGVTTIRAGLAAADLGQRLDDLGHLLELVDGVNAE